MIPQNVHIGAYIHCANQALAPTSHAAGSRGGTAIDVSGFQSAVLVANLGAATGTPTALSITYSLESSASSSSGWTEVTDLSGNAVELTTDQAGKAVELDVNLQWLPPGHAYLRVNEVVTFTGGASPTVVTGVTLVLGGGQRLPV